MANRVVRIDLGDDVMSDNKTSKHKKNKLLKVNLSNDSLSKINGGNAALTKEQELEEKFKEKLAGLKCTSCGKFHFSTNTCQKK